MPLLSSKTWVFAVAETLGFPSLRAWLPGEDKQIHEKEAQKKLSNSWVTLSLVLSLRGLRHGVLGWMPLGSFEPSRRNILETPLNTHMNASISL